MHDDAGTRRRLRDPGPSVAWRLVNRGALDLILYAGGYVMWLAGDALFRTKPRERLAAAARRRRKLVAQAEQERRENGPPELPPGTPRRKPRPELFEPNPKAPPRARWPGSICGVSTLASLPVKTGLRGTGASPSDADAPAA